MKTIIRAFILAAAFLILSPDAHSTGTVYDYRFFSKSLKREMAGRMYLPGGYDPKNAEKRFPVVYFLHGATDGYQTYDAIYSVLDYMISFQMVKPFILVLPDGLVPPYDGSFYTNSALYGNFEDYISHDLISFIDSAFNTKNVRGQRAIMGASMGAYGALKIAFKHQELFIGVAGHSGPVNINMVDPIIPDLIAENGGTAPYHWSPGPGKSLTNLTFTMAGAFSPNLNNIYKVDFPVDSLAKPITEVMDRWKNENVCEIAKIYLPGTKLGIRFDCGDADEFYLYYQNRSLADTLTKYNINFEYKEYPGTHTSGIPAQAVQSVSYFDKLFLSTDAGIPLLPSGLQWAVYPTPASNTLTISSNNNGPYLDKQIIQIADATGRVVLRQMLMGDSDNINTSSLPNGLYFIKIQCGNIMQNGKILILH